MLFEEIDTLLRSKLSPEEYKINNEFYGLQYRVKNSDSLIKKIMLTTDLNLEAIHYATVNKFNLIISYRSLVNKPIDYFNQNLVNKITLLSKYPVSIYVLNSSLIAAEGGISDIIREALYLDLDKTFDIRNRYGDMIPLGRVCLPTTYPNQKEPLNLKDLLNRIKVNLELNNINFVGDLTQSINKINIIGDILANIKYLEATINLGCNCLIVCDFDYKEALYARDLELCLIKIPHYNCEIKCMKRLCNILSLEFPNDEIFLYESRNPIRIF